MIHEQYNKTLLLKIVDYDYFYLLVETPKAHNRFLLSRGKITEIEFLTEEQLKARLNGNPTSEILNK